MAIRARVTSWLKAGQKQLDRMIDGLRGLAPANVTSPQPYWAEPEQQAEVEEAPAETPSKSPVTTQPAKRAVTTTEGDVEFAEGARQGEARRAQLEPVDEERATLAAHRVLMLGIHGIFVRSDGTRLIPVNQNPEDAGPEVVSALETATSAVAVADVWAVRERGGTDREERAAGVAVYRDLALAFGPGETGFDSEPIVQWCALRARDVIKFLDGPTRPEDQDEEFAAAVMAAQANKGPDTRSPRDLLNVLLNEPDLGAALDKALDVELKHMEAAGHHDELGDFMADIETLTADTEAAASAEWATRFEEQLENDTLTPDQGRDAGL